MVNSVMKMTSCERTCAIKGDEFVMLEEVESCVYNGLKVPVSFGKLRRQNVRCIMMKENCIVVC